MERPCRPSCGSLNWVLGQRGARCPPEVGGTWHPGPPLKTSRLVTPCFANRTMAAKVPLDTSHHGAASPPRDRCPYHSHYLTISSHQLVPLRSVTQWPLAQATSTSKEPTGYPQRQDAIENRAPAVLAGCWDMQNYPHSMSLATVSSSLWSLWASTGTPDNKGLCPVSQAL